MKLAQTLCAAPWMKASLTAAAILFLTSNGRPLPVKLTGAALRRHAPIRVHRQRDQQAWESENWSGYAVTGANGSVSSVTNSWIVPHVNCTVAPAGYASFWVGIDGFTSSTVEQIGTDSDCVNLEGTESGTPTYYAWFEFYPQNSYLIEFPRSVQPGDVIVAQVKAVGKGSGFFGRNSERFTVTLTDVTQDETFSTTSSVPGAKQSSAEWIAEAPCCENSGSFLPLADFGTIDFGSDFTSASSTAFATVGTTTAAIGKFGANVQEITMVTASTPTATKAQPSGLSKDGSSFSVAWLNAGP